MIAGAEASRIARALESVAEWVGEIVVVINADVDDGTEQIAARHGAKIFREPWKGFRDQKNSAAQKATQQWVLSLDADEVVSTELRDDIGKLFADGRPKGFAAFDMPRLSVCCGHWLRHGDWYPDRQIRFWRKGAAQWGGGSVHEKLVVDGPLGHLRGDLLHFSMDSLDRHLERISEYSTCFAQDWIAKGRRPGAVDLVLRPFWRFLRCYFLRLGFLDGWVGFYLAWQTAFACLTRYAKVREALATCSTSPSSSSPATPAR